MIREVLKHEVYYRSYTSAGSLMPSTSTSMGLIIILGISFLMSLLFSSPTFASTHSLSMSTSGTVNVDVSTTGNGTAVGQDNLTIISTCPNGYTVTIKGPNNTNLYKDGNTANNATNTKITPSAGTISNPLPITDNTSNGGANYRGTWGYSLTSSVSTGNFIGLTSTTTTLFTKNTASGDGNIVGNGTSTGTTDTIPIYYGVSTTLDQAPGLYTMSSTNNSNGAITYFITTPQSCTSYTVAYNPTSTANSTTLTGTGTMPNQTISEDTATNLNTNAFAAPTGYSFNGWNTKQDGTGTHYANNASVTNLIPAGQTITLYAEWTPNSYTCTKRYRLQNADGTFPDTYTADTTEQVPYNTTCTYTKSVTDYKGVYNGTNNAQASTSHLMDSTNGITLSLDLYRNTYTLVVHGDGTIAAASATTTAVHDSNYYRWGQEVSLSATKAANTTCKSYGTITWSQLWNTTVIQMGHAQGTFTPSTTGNNVAFIMGKGNALVEATSAVSNVAQTITLSKTGGVSGINIGGTNYTGSSVSLTCGTYNISGNYPSGYEFSFWSRAGSVTVASTSSASTTMTVSGPGTLTLNAESSKSYLQNFTASTCSGLTLNDDYTFYDSRDDSDYTVARLADGNCWMTQNLRLGKGNGEVIALNSTNSDLPSGRTFNLKASGMAWDGGDAPDASGDCYVGDWYPDTAAKYYDVSHLCINTDDVEAHGVYYNWYTATAGTGTYDVGEDEDAVGSICPKGWRLPPNEGSKSYYNLLTTTLNLSGSAGSTTMRNSPYNFPLSGFTYGEGIDYGGYGTFLSSTAYDEESIYALYFDSSDIVPQGIGIDKGDGFSVRCVFRS